MAGGINLATAYYTLLPSMQGTVKAMQDQLTPAVASVGGKSGKALGGRLTAGIGSAIKSTATATVGAAAGFLGVALTKGFGRLVAIDNARAKLAGLGHSAKDVGAIMDDALASVKGTAFGLDEAATVAASTVAAGVKPGKALQSTLKLVADAATISGSSMSEMGAIFNKVASGNKVSAREIMQLNASGIPIQQFLAKSMGKSVEQVNKLVSAGKVGFPEFQKAMQAGLGGAALESGKTFTGALKNMFASIGRIGANLESGMFPALAPLFTSLTGALGPVEDAAKGIGQTIGTKVVPVVKAFSGGLNDLISGLTMTKDIAAGIGAPLDGLVKIGYGIRDGFGQVKQVIAPLLAAFVALGASGLAPLLGKLGLGGLASKLAFLGGPIGLIVSAIGGLIATSPQLRAAFGSGLQSIFQTIGQVMQTLAPVMDKLMGAFQTVAGVVAGALTSAIKVVVPVINQLITLFGGMVASILPKLIPVITQLAGLFSGVVQAVMPVVSSLATMLMPVITQLAGFFTRLVSAVMPLVSTLIAALMPAFRTVIAAIMPIIQTVMPPLMAVFNAIMPIIMKVVNILVAYLVPAVKVVTGIFQGLVNFVVGVFTGNWSKAWDGVKQIFTAWWDGVKAIVDGVLSLFGGLPGNIKGYFTGALSWLKQAGTNIINGLKNGVTTAWNTVMSWLGGIGGRVLSAIGNTRDLLVNAGKNILQGFLDGLHKAWDKVTGFVGGIGKWIADHKGPKSYDLALLVPNGGWIMQGLGEGIRKGLPGLRGELGSVASEIAGTDFTGRVSMAASGALSAASQTKRDVYVQNPFTGEYLLARVGSEARREVQSADRASERRLMQGVM